MLGRKRQRDSQMAGFESDSAGNSGGDGDGQDTQLKLNRRASDY